MHFDRWPSIWPGNPSPSLLLPVVRLRCRQFVLSWFIVGRRASRCRRSCAGSSSAPRRCPSTKPSATRSSSSSGRAPTPPPGAPSPGSHGCNTLKSMALMIFASCPKRRETPATGRRLKHCFCQMGWPPSQILFFSCTEILPPFKYPPAWQVSPELRVALCRGDMRTGGGQLAPRPTV